MDFVIEEVQTSNRKEYETYIFTKESTTFVDSIEWREIVSSTYNLRQFWFIAKESGEITGVLNLTLVTHPIFGRYLATAPFANRGGFYADSDAAFYGLLDKAQTLQVALKAKYVLIRHIQTKGQKTIPPGWINDSLYASYNLDLAEHPDIFWKKHLRSKIRNLFSKSMKQELKAVFGRQELLDPFWHVINLSMKELGSPYHSKYYLKTLLNLLGSKAELTVIFTKDDRPAACALLISHKNHVVLLHANSLVKYKKMIPSDFLYWSIVSRLCNGDITYLDMGRSIIGSGNEAFKMKLRPVKKPLSYWYLLAPGIELPKLNQDNPRFRFVRKIWQKMPLWLTMRIGPHLISGIL